MNTGVREPGQEGRKEHWGYSTWARGYEVKNTGVRAPGQEDRKEHWG